ncbi:hypothetical protein GCM10007876_25650 [Litoribrevibacter albus]|uniref:DUF2175 domain-containing protein n=2 Tax=Litoribrevibacter albus TaxID=1473156 RepID=A0AA37SB93_9GAMM|nr:hypothetical protein GCM10007876_25650 [Litoribrevibacter albus]
MEFFPDISILAGFLYFDAMVSFFMRCVYCDASVVGSRDAVTVEGGAPAHANCYKYKLVSQRVFRDIKLTDLTDSELNELHELVKSEVNSRSVVCDEIELF